jgi:voltage-gated potassium channel
MKEVYRIADWVHAHRWSVLLVSLLALLVISPISDVFNRADNVISPLAGVVFFAIAASTGLRRWTRRAMMLLIAVWVVISVCTDGSGLFAGESLVAPVLFLVIMGLVFLLVARWMARISVVNAEALCAALCGYLIVGIFWAGLYALAESVDAHAIVAQGKATMEHGDLLYFSFTTLTTTGFGDLVPKNPTARMWTVLEAVIGTFYNAIVIARLVTLYGFKQIQSAKE